MIRDFFDVFGYLELNRKDWLIMGKGPSFNPSLATNHKYHTVTINQAIKYVDRSYFASIIDAPVCMQIEDAILMKCNYLVMPYFPHIKPNIDEGESIISIHKLMQNPEYKVIKSMCDMGRLLCYNLASSKERVGNYPSISMGWFSGDVLTELLALNGVQKLKTNGIDGGTEYASNFSGLKALENGQPDFNKQLERMEQLAEKYDLTLEKI